MKLSTLSTALLFIPFIQGQMQVELKPTFQDVLNSKNFAFVAAIGGSSHYNWVLSIGDELGIRGHNFTFVTSDQDVRYANQFPNINAVGLGPGPNINFKEMAGIFKVAKKNPLKFMLFGLDKFFQNFERDYHFVKKFIVEHKIDVVVCDHFSDPCIDAATTLNIPYIVSSCLDLTKESGAPYLNQNLMTTTEPTSEFQSFIERFKGKFIEPVKFLYHVLPTANKQKKLKEAMGIQIQGHDPSTKWKYSLKLVNNLFGFTPARPIGALTELVGPIIPKTYVPMTNEFESYFNTHKKVVYVAFGEKATPDKDDITLILTSLLESLENKFIDGIVWATVSAAGHFPDSIATSSGITYNVGEFFNDVHPDIRLIKRAPQTAILLHPSTRLFISHGGLTSWYESMYAGTAMLMFPFFGDQPSNSFMIEKNNLGRILKSYYTVNQVVDIIQNIINDKDGKIKSSIQSYQALMQIHTRRGISKAADVIEEVAYTHINGRLPHRESADKRMSFIKSHNIDLYAVLILILISGVFSSIVLLKSLCSLFINQKSSSEKIKTH